MAAGFRTEAGAQADESVVQVGGVDDDDDAEQPGVEQLRDVARERGQRRDLRQEGDRQDPPEQAEGAPPPPGEGHAAQQRRRGGEDEGLDSGVLAGLGGSLLSFSLGSATGARQSTTIGSDCSSATARRPMWNASVAVGVSA